MAGNQLQISIPKNFHRKNYSIPKSASRISIKSMRSYGKKIKRGKERRKLLRMMLKKVRKLKKAKKVQEIQKEIHSKIRIRILGGIHTGIMKRQSKWKKHKL